MEQQFSRYVSEHRALIYKVSRMFGQDAEAQKDLAQEILLQLWRSFPRYDAQFKWTTWAYRIALNAAITWKRAERKSIPVISDELPELPDIRNETANEQSSQLWVAIEQLSAAEKALLLLYFDEMPYAAIGEVMGLSETNVGARLSRIKQKLKTIIAHGA